MTWHALTLDVRHVGWLGRLINPLSRHPSPTSELRSCIAVVTIQWSQLFANVASETPIHSRSIQSSRLQIPLAALCHAYQPPRNPQYFHPCSS